MAPVDGTVAAASVCCSGVHLSPCKIGVYMGMHVCFSRWQPAVDFRHLPLVGKGLHGDSVESAMAMVLHFLFFQSQPSLWHLPFVVNEPHVSMESPVVADSTNASSTAMRASASFNAMSVFCPTAPGSPCLP